MIEIIPLAILLYASFVAHRDILVDKLTEIVSKEDISVGRYLNINSLEDIDMVIKEIKYETELRDNTQYPIETVRKGSGDCDDFAILTYSILKYLGYEPGIAIAYNDDDPEAHAFTFANINGEYHIFSNNDHFKADSVFEAASMLGFENVIYITDAKCVKCKEVC